MFKRDFFVVFETWATDPAMQGLYIDPHRVRLRPVRLCLVQRPAELIYFLSPVVLLRKMKICRNNLLSFCIISSPYIVHYV